MTTSQRIENIIHSHFERGSRRREKVSSFPPFPWNKPQISGWSCEVCEKSTTLQAVQQSMGPTTACKIHSTQPGPGGAFLGPTDTYRQTGGAALYLYFGVSSILLSISHFSWHGASCSLVSVIGSSDLATRQIGCDMNETCRSGEPDKTDWEKSS